MIIVTTQTKTFFEIYTEIFSINFLVLFFKIASRICAKKLLRSSIEKGLAYNLETGKNFTKNKRRKQLSPKSRFPEKKVYNLKMSRNINKIRFGSQI